MTKTKVVFLYSEIAGYFLACAEELAKSCEVMIVRWPINQEAPFQFKINDRIQVVEKNAFTKEALKSAVHEFAPNILVCSGWMDEDYVAIAKSFEKKIPVVLTLDNHWTGSFRQRLGTIVSKIIYTKIFTHAWVPGGPQKIFAEKLGFKGKVIQNFYCADVDLFNEKYQQTFEAKRKHFPKKFLFAARYVKHKGIFELWEAFKELQAENPNDWELWCIGTGDQFDHKTEHSKIKHFGFVQPAEFEKYIAQTGVYVLPSTFEPWGVSVQEFAICGYPLILSSAIGARTKYLEDNGEEFSAGNKNALKAELKKFMQMNDSSLLEMAEKSHALGMSFTPKMWVENLLSIRPEK